MMSVASDDTHVTCGESESVFAVFNDAACLKKAVRTTKNKNKAHDDDNLRPIRIPWLEPKNRDVQEQRDETEAGDIVSYKV
jgi:hypothetical protein